MTGDLTHDAFLCGKLHLWQPKQGYRAATDPVHLRDFHATLLHQLGINHTQLTYMFQGRRFRLTDVHGKVVKDLFA